MQSGMARICINKTASEEMGLNGINIKCHERFKTGRTLAVGFREEY